MKCPNCGSETITSYGVKNLCKNKECKFYLVDDVTKLMQHTKSNVVKSNINNVKYDFTNQIQGILNSYDFYKVEKVMKALNWKWASHVSVPTVPQMKRMAEDLLKQASKNSNKEGYIVSSGGFQATAISEADYHSLKLDFIVESFEEDSEAF